MASKKNRPVNSPIIYVCDHVFNKERPVLLIVHHDDGMWQLTCGQNDHSVGGASITPVHIHHIVNGDDDLANAMLDTPKGQLSELKEGKWIISPFDEEGDD